MPKEAPIGRCQSCEFIRPVRRVGVDEGRDVFACASCVPWGEGVSAYDHRVQEAREGAREAEAVADGGDR